MSIHEEILLQDCPYCGGAGLLEEESGWCWYAICMDCGAQTAALDYHRPQDREQTARQAANLWNIGKILRGGFGD